MYSLFVKKIWRRKTFTSYFGFEVFWKSSTIISPFPSISTPALSSPSLPVFEVLQINSINGCSLSYLELSNLKLWSKIILNCVTDLKAHPARSNQKLNFCFPAQEWECSKPKLFWEVPWFFSAAFHLRQIGGKIQMFTTSCRIFTIIPSKFFKSLGPSSYITNIVN